jgi:hypothetical protein
MGLPREFIYWSHQKLLMGVSLEFNGIVTKTWRICHVNSWSREHNKWSRGLNGWSLGHNRWSREHNRWSRRHSGLSRSYNGWSGRHNRWFRGYDGWSRNHNGCVMRNLKGGHKTLTSQFLCHIFPVHYEWVNFLVYIHVSKRVTRTRRTLVSLR